MGFGYTIPSPTVLLSSLGDYVATIEENSHVFSFPAIDFTGDSELILIVSGSAAAAFDLQLRINANATGNYFVDGRRINAGVETLIDLNSQTEGELINTVFITGAGAYFSGIGHIILPKGSSFTGIKTIFNGAGSGTGQQQSSVLLSVDTDDVTDVEIRTSGGNWRVNTRFTLYRVNRT